MTYKGYELIEVEEPPWSRGWWDVQLEGRNVAWAADLEAARWEIDLCEKLGTHLGAHVRLRDGSNTGVINGQHQTLDIQWDRPNVRGLHEFTVLYCDVEDNPDKELRKARRILSHMVISQEKEVTA